MSTMKAMGARNYDFSHTAEIILQMNFFFQLTAQHISSNIIFTHTSTHTIKTKALKFMYLILNAV